MDIFWNNTRRTVLFLKYTFLSSPIDNPLYTTADQQKPVPKPGASSSSSKTNSPVKEPLDSIVPYATPQKKNKPKKSRKDPQEITTSGESFIKHEMVQQK